MDAEKPSVAYGGLCVVGQQVFRLSHTPVLRVHARMGNHYTRSGTAKDFFFSSVFIFIIFFKNIYIDAFGNVIGLALGIHVVENTAAL